MTFARCDHSACHDPTPAAPTCPDIQVSPLRIHARRRLDALDQALTTLSEIGPWPARQRDHVFVVSLDRGRCFQDDLRDRFGNATVLSYEGTRAYPGKALPFACHQSATDVVIPPVVDAGVASVVNPLPAGLAAGREYPSTFFGSSQARLCFCPALLHDSKLVLNSVAQTTVTATP